MNGSSTEERVDFVADRSVNGRFLPQVASAESMRPFEPEDMPRVLDFDGLSEAPADGALMFCEDHGKGGLKFPIYHFCLRGGRLFYFKVDDVDDESGPYITYHSSPVGVIPLDQVTIQFPPGGRRVFREHAQTEARSGYELVIVHDPEDEDNRRPPAYLITESLGHREKWASALRERAEASKPTVLRAGYTSSTTRAKTPSPAVKATATKNAVSAPTQEPVVSQPKPATRVEEPKLSQSRKSSSSGRKRESKSSDKQILTDDPELSAAVNEFGANGFNELDWINHYFQTQNYYDAPTKLRLMEAWQAEMKKSLKGAVLEQYEYFVQASGEMTTMGKEIAALKGFVETQADTIKQMKEVDYTGAIRYTGKDEIMGQDDDDAGSGRRRTEKNQRGDDNSVTSEVSSVDRGAQEESNFDDGDDDAPPIVVPEFLNDVGEEIAAIVRECRYNDAIELYLKAMGEITDLLDKHDRPTPYRLKKRQVDMLESTRKSLGTLVKRIGSRLEQSLRRKNESLRQAFKRERSDVNAIASLVVSPCALHDDALYLQLLVKLGRTQEAAEAYTSRRSLLLQETLQERPVSGSGSVDLVIYAAQLSQSFFTCLASSVEEFLDLFIISSSTGTNVDREDNSLDASSLHSQVAKKVPPGSLASVVLWCDVELTKFAAAFGGTRILSNLALSPPPRAGGTTHRGPRVLGEDDGAKERKNAIDVAAQCLDQAFLYASQNLDTVGLPLTPRLAELLRDRLKGCEREIALLLDERWRHLTADWTLDMTDEER